MLILPFLIIINGFFTVINPAIQDTEYLKALSELSTEEQRYKKYFMTNQNATSEDVWNDFLNQPANSNGEGVINLTSYPNTISTAWLSIESLFRQEHTPSRIILHLSEADFPEKSLPVTIQQQITRGLEIKWYKPTDTKAKVQFTRSDVLHPSPSIPYFSTHSLNDLIIIPYNVQLAASSSNDNTLICKESDTFHFTDASHQFMLLGGELTFLDTSIFKSELVYNPSIAIFKNKRYMTFRVQGHRKWPNFSEVFFAELDNDYSIKNPFSLIKDSEALHEDARLAVKKNALCISYVSNASPKGYQAYMDVSLFEPYGPITDLIRPEIDNNRSPKCMQKNWLYFEKEDTFLLINNIYPLEVWDSTQNFSNPTLMCKKSILINEWKCGEPRASTTPLYLEEYNLWLIFFHSHIKPPEKTKTYLDSDNARTYFIGALTFDNDFNITAYTDKPLLVGTPFIKKATPLMNKFTGAKTILPYGCIRENDDLVLSLGINDVKSAIGRLPLQRVMETLKYIS